MTRSIPQFIHRRVFWLIPLAVWVLCVSALLFSQIRHIESQALNVGVEGMRNMFRMIVLTRAWSAQHGGVYMAVSKDVQPNPYLVHPRRDIASTTGQRLTEHFAAMDDAVHNYEFEDALAILNRVQPQHASAPAEGPSA